MNLLSICPILNPKVIPSPPYLILLIQILLLNYDPYSLEKIDLLKALGARVEAVPAVAFTDPNNYNHQAKRLGYQYIFFYHYLYMFIYISFPFLVIPKDMLRVSRTLFGATNSITLRIRWDIIWYSISTI